MVRGLFVAVLLALLAAGGCGPRDGSETLTVLAGSELEDMSPLLERIERATGVKLELHYTGTLDAAERLDRGEAFDLAWLSQAKYLRLLDRAGQRVVAQDKTMLSPVVLGVKESDAQRWGWVGNPGLSWREIAAKAASGALRFAMTDPSASNSGFSALLGVAAAVSGAADALRPEAVDPSALTGFFQGQRLTAGSSGWLVDAYVQAEDQLNGIINYESVLLRLNDSGRLKERLYLVYPKEGIVTADYPLILLDPARRPAYQRLVSYLRSPQFQQAMMEKTLRRPVIPQVKPGPRFPTALLVELPFPDHRATIDQLLFAYFDRYRRPSHVFFALDVSGSMAGERLAALQSALGNLTGLDTSLTGRFARFRSREKVTLIPFATEVHEPRTFLIDDPSPDGAAMRAIRAYAQGLAAEGSTAIYDAVLAAYRQAIAAQRTEPDRFYSIVLMTDGERTAGLDQDEFLAALAPLQREAPIKVFTILFGEASQAEMERLSTVTGGREFDGRHSLAQAFKAIRGYQ
ncbi:substrate-binding and VWA domain-containing protein [Candidatus Methylocalor cossyra]|uniref:VWA domain-containing protein n=1 Tax=Candidatus Methylocalor cossyra TaxID=3108543 RepID=A0ABP1C888_9GAMM